MSQMENFNTLNFQLEKFESQDDDFFFWAKSLTCEFVPKEQLYLLATDSINKHLVWKHRHPIDPKYKEYPILGKVVESEVVDDEYILSKYLVYGHTKTHQQLRKEIIRGIEKGDPVSVSMRFRTYYETPKKEKVIHCDVFEHTNTFIPACQECIVLDYQNESDEIMDEQKVQEEIKKLEEQLSTKEQKLEELKAKIEDLEKDLISKVDEIKVKDQSLESTKKGFEEKVLELESKIDMLDKSTVLGEIEKLEGKTILSEIYKTKPKSWLEKRLEEVKAKVVTPSTQTLDESASEAQSEDESLEVISEDKAFSAIKHIIKQATLAAKEIEGDF